MAIHQWCIHLLRVIRRYISCPNNYLKTNICLSTQWCSRSKKKSRIKINLLNPISQISLESLILHPVVKKIIQGLYNPLAAHTSHGRLQTTFRWRQLPAPKLRSSLKILAVLKNRKLAKETAKKRYRSSKLQVRKTLTVFLKTTNRKTNLKNSVRLKMTMIVTSMEGSLRKENIRWMKESTQVSRSKANLRDYRLKLSLRKNQS